MCHQEQEKHTLFPFGFSKTQKHNCCVCTVHSLAAPHFLLWCRFFYSGARRRDTHHSTGLAPNMPNHFLYHWGVGGGSCVCPHGQNLYLPWVIFAREIQWCSPFQPRTHRYLATVTRKSPGGDRKRRKTSSER